MADPIKDPADPNVNPGGDDEEPKEKTVSRSAYEKSVAAEKAARVRAQDAEKKLKAIDDAAKAAADAEALKRGEHEKIIADKDKALAEKDERLAKIEADRLEARKLGAFLKGIGGELGEDYYALVDLDKIKADADGKIDPGSVKEYADQFRTKHAVLIGKTGDKSPPGNKAGGLGGKGATVDEFRELAATDLKAAKLKLAEAHKNYASRKK